MSTSDGRVIAFIKAAGGTGATTIAMQAACARPNTGTAVIDLDIQFGSAAFQMDVSSPVSILDLAAAIDRLDPALLRGAMVRVNDAFDLLAAPDGVYPLEDLSAEVITSVLQVARTIYRTVIVDLPPVWNDWTYTALAKADHIVLVMQLTLPALRQGRRQIEMLKRELLGNTPLFVVANHANSGWLAPKIAPEQAERALGRPIDAIIPHDRNVATAAASGLPLSGLNAAKMAKRFGAVIEAVLGAAKPVLEEA